MSDLKEGDLVKAWDDDGGSFVIGILSDMPNNKNHDYSVWVNHDAYKNAVKIPDGLTKQLEKLK